MAFFVVLGHSQVSVQGSFLLHRFLFFWLDMLESCQIFEELGAGVTELVQGVSSGFFVHFGPRLLFKDGDRLWNLCDQTERIRLHVVQKSSKAALALLRAVGFHVPHGRSEVTVLIIEEEQINGVVGKSLRTFEGDPPEVVNQASFESVHKAQFFGDPSSEALLSGLLYLTAHSVETLVHAEPDFFRNVGVVFEPGERYRADLLLGVLGSQRIFRVIKEVRDLVNVGRLGGDSESSQTD